MSDGGVNDEKFMLGRSALIGYGSETGNAQDYAEEVGRALERLRFNTTVCELNALDIVCCLPPWLLRCAYEV